jgi:hypothetical protein
MFPIAVDPQPPCTIIDCSDVQVIELRGLRLGIAIIDGFNDLVLYFHRYATGLVFIFGIPVYNRDMDAILLSEVSA